MTYKVILTIEAVEDVLRITMESGAKLQVLQASKRIQESLELNPDAEGELLSEGLYFIDCEPLRAFFIINVQEKLVEIVNVKAHW